MNYSSSNTDYGTVATASRVYTLQDENGNPVENGKINLTNTANTNIPDPDVPLNPGTTITDPEVPLASASGLNATDHFAYIAGYPDGTVRPQSNIAHAETMTLVNRMLNRVPDKEHMLSDMDTWPDNSESAWYYEAVQEATNSHDYDRDEMGVMEIWTAMLTNRDWVALETEWANAASGSNGAGDVADNLK